MSYTQYVVNEDRNLYGFFLRKILGPTLKRVQRQAYIHMCQIIKYSLLQTAFCTFQALSRGTFTVNRKQAWETRKQTLPTK